MTIIDFTQYSNMPRLDVAAAYVLACKLTETPPSDLTAAERSALRKIRLAAQRLQDVQRAHDAQPTGVVRPCQLAVTAAWSAMYTALLAVARLPSGSHLDIERAKRVLETLFPNGISFTVQDAKSVFNDGQVLLTRIDEAGLVTDLHRVIDDDFLVAVRTQHAALRSALGIGKEPHALEVVGTVLNDLMREMLSYARILAGSVDVDDPASVQRFADAVQPIDEARATTTRTPVASASPSPSPTPTPPHTEPPAPPPAHSTTPGLDSPFLPPASSPGTVPSAE